MADLAAGAWTGLAGREGAFRGRGCASFEPICMRGRALPAKHCALVSPAFESASDAAFPVTVDGEAVTTVSGVLGVLATAATVPVDGLAPLEATTTPKATANPHSAPI